jgi:DNA polymerase III alpha subunit
MRQNEFGELIFAETDLVNLVMQGRDLSAMGTIIVDHTVSTDTWPNEIMSLPGLQPEQSHDCSVDDWHAQQQAVWHMPDQYRQLDIAAHVLALCKTEAELQRCGTELLLYQERDLFNLLRYLTYLVDVMTEHSIIWGVGRGSSVASYVLYKLGVHRIDSLHYKLDPHEFLR